MVLRVIFTFLYIVMYNFFLLIHKKKKIIFHIVTKCSRNFVVNLKLF